MSRFVSVLGLEVSECTGGSMFGSVMLGQGLGVY